MQYATVEKMKIFSEQKYIIIMIRMQEIGSVVLLNYQPVLVFQIIDANLIALMDTGGSQEMMISFNT